MLDNCEYGGTVNKTFRLTPRMSSRSIRLTGALIILMMSLTGLMVSVRSSSAASCGMQMGGPVAFCDTFNAPSPTGNRSGDLNGAIWGVSRLTQNWNPSGQFNQWGFGTTSCGGSGDVRICNGQLHEAQSDLGSVTTLAMYPKQPFDFSGRTGTISFDVSNDTKGSHTAWPEVWITNKPTPAPLEHPTQDDSNPEFGIGLQFEGSIGLCPDGQWTVDNIILVSNYSATTTPMTIDGCVIKASGPKGPLNHVEIRISASQVDVYASDPGSTTLRHIAEHSGAVPLTRGLVWLNDTHYNGDKDGNGQGTHEFTWDNFAFDGPYTYQDRSFDVLDNTSSQGTGYKLGTVMHTMPVDAASLNNATGALVMWNYTNWHNPTTASFTLNGHAYNVPAQPVYSQALYMPVSLSDVVTGANTIVVTGGDMWATANVNLVLVAAVGGSPPPPRPSTSTPSPTKTSTPSPTPTGVSATVTSTAQPSATATPTKQPSATPTPTSQPTSPAPPGAAWTLTSQPSVSSVTRGSDIMLMTDIASSTSASAMIDIELYDASGKRVLQQFVDQQSFVANGARPFGIVYKVPTNAARGKWTVKVGVFNPGWGALMAWNESAATFTVR